MRKSISIAWGLAMMLIGIQAIRAQAGAQADAQTWRAQETLNQARAALGGEDKLKSVRSLSASGQYRRVVQNQDMSGELKLDFLLPDKFMKTETINMFGGAAGVSMVTALNGDQAWRDARTGPNSPGGQVMIRRPGMDEKKAEAVERPQLRAEYARLMLAWLISSLPSLPIEFRYAGEAEAEDGRADVLEGQGPDGWRVRLFLDKQTHIPLMLTYRGALPRIALAKGGKGDQPPDIDKIIKEAEKKAQNPEAARQEAEIQMRFSDYRSVDGIRLPHRITKTVNGEVNEEWEIKKFKVNPSLKPEMFRK